MGTCTSPAQPVAALHSPLLWERCGETQRGWNPAQPWGGGCRYLNKNLHCASSLMRWSHEKSLTISFHSKAALTWNRNIYVLINITWKLEVISTCAPFLNVHEWSPSFSDSALIFKCYLLSSTWNYSHCPRFPSKLKKKFPQKFHWYFARRLFLPNFYCMHQLHKW